MRRLPGNRALGGIALHEGHAKAVRGKAGSEFRALRQRRLVCGGVPGDAPVLPRRGRRGNRILRSGIVASPRLHHSTVFVDVNARPARRGRSGGRRRRSAHTPTATRPRRRPPPRGRPASRARRRHAAASGHPSGGQAWRRAFRVDGAHRRAPSKHPAKHPARQGQFSADRENPEWTSFRRKPPASPVARSLSPWPENPARGSKTILIV